MFGGPDQDSVLIRCGFDGQPIARALEARAAAGNQSLHDAVYLLTPQGTTTRRLMCPFCSQYVLLLARNGSSGAGCMLPSTSNARDVT